MGKVFGRECEDAVKSRKILRSDCEDCSRSIDEHAWKTCLEISDDMECVRRFIEFVSFHAPGITIDHVTSRANADDSIDPGDLKRPTISISCIAYVLRDHRENLACTIDRMHNTSHAQHRAKKLLRAVKQRAFWAERIEHEHEHDGSDQAGDLFHGRIG